mgnify:CR=1 FL=1
MNVRELVTVLKFKTDTASIKAAENAVNKIKSTMSKIKPANIKVNTGNATRQVNTLQNKINRLATAKRINIGVNTAQLNQATQALNRFSQAQTRASQSHYRGKAQGLAQGGRQQAQSGGMGMMMGGLKGAFMALGGYAILSEIKQTADAMMSLSSRIKIVTKDDAERLKIETALYNMSNKNRSSLEDLGDLYYKTALASKRFGASQEDVLKLTDIVSKSLVIGGADVAQQKATILQLSQALGSGVLQGDELRSLRENAPILMDAIATYFNTDVGGLKEMGAKGMLTTEKLMQAILSSGDAVDSKFAQITPTIGQAMTVLGNKFSKLILDIQNSTGIFGTIAGLILQGVDLIGQAIDWVMEEFGTATPEMMGMVEDFKELWKSLQPFIEAVGTIFKNWVVPAMKIFGKVASSVLGMAATLLKPIADILGTIANLIATISGGLPSILKGFDNLVSKAESGAMQKYQSIVQNQNNTYNLQSERQMQVAMEQADDYFDWSPAK